MKKLLYFGVLVALFGMYSMGNAAGTLKSSLAWTNTDTTNGVQVEKASSSTGVFTMLKQLLANTVSYDDVTNGSGETACYRMAYYNTSGVGPYSFVVCKTFPTVPTQAPAAFTVN